MHNDSSNLNLIILGAITCGLAVALGAFGAHALENAIGDWYEGETAAKKLASWETAVRYQMYHGLGLLILAALANCISDRWLLKLAAILFATGIAIFSGGLYAWVLTDIKPFVIAVPLGGLAMIAGWITIAVAAFKSKRNTSTVC